MDVKRKKILRKSLSFLLTIILSVIAFLFLIACLHYMARDTNTGEKVIAYLYKKYHLQNLFFIADIVALLVFYAIFFYMLLLYTKQNIQKKDEVSIFFRRKIIWILSISIIAILFATIAMGFEGFIFSMVIIPFLIVLVLMISS